EMGYQGVGLSEGLDVMSGKKKMTRLPVVITFDDGFRDFHTSAFPALRRHNFSATMYLPTAFIGDSRRSFKSRECLTWNEVTELHENGIEFGSHTVNHPRLTDLGWSDIDTELRQSKDSIECRLGCSVSAFGYPYAFPQADKSFTRRFNELLAAIGYQSCATTTIGRASFKHDILQLPRLPINTDDDRSLFIAKMDGAYDWAGVPQSLKKRITRFLRSDYNRTKLDCSAEILPRSKS
ncbi:MAG TPA: polysaccharide deacetylase family protein, partial [Opitutaceae bacterium]|nr:polysaccharide deacetylase family protein [Opitutaceae bacterium]